MLKETVRHERAQILSLAAPPRARTAIFHDYCHVTGCNNPTTERKEYCTDHIDRSNYVQTVQQQLAVFEMDQIEAGKPIPTVRLESPWVREILLQLTTKGVLTLTRLSIVVELPEYPLENYVKLMHTAGLVRYISAGSRRGTIRKLVQITEIGRSRVALVE